MKDEDLLVVKEAALFSYRRMDAGDRENLAEHLDLNEAEVERIFEALEVHMNNDEPTKPTIWARMRNYFDVK